MKEQDFRYVFISHVNEVQPQTSMRFHRKWILSRPGKLYEKFMLHLIGGAALIQAVESLLRYLERHI